MFEFVNVNPCKRRLGDCVIRALSLALNQQWERTYIDLCIEGFTFRDMPNANNVWDSYLRSKGYKRYIIPNTCPDCYTIENFAEDHPHGTYIVATGSHVVCVKDGGQILDNWDSSQEVPTYYYTKEQDYGEL